MPAMTARPGGGPGRDPRHEFGLADGFQAVGTVLAVAGAALDEHGLLDVVPGARVRPQVLQQVGRPPGQMARRPQVVVGIDDRPFGFYDLLGDLGEPGLGAGGRCHRDGSPYRLGSLGGYSRARASPAASRSDQSASGIGAWNSSRFASISSSEVLPGMIDATAG